MEVSEKIVCLLPYMVVNVIVAKRSKSLLSETMGLSFLPEMFIALPMPLFLW